MSMPMTVHAALQILGLSCIVLSQCCVKAAGAECSTCEPVVSPMLLQRQMSEVQQDKDIVSHRANPEVIRRDHSENLAQVNSLGRLQPDRNRGQCLKFLHIPKTGGSSIEEASNDTNWGYYARWEMHCANLRHMCKDYEKCAISGDAGDGCSAWHVPPALDLKIRQYYTNCNTFCIVRHPVDRFVSAYKYEFAKRWKRGVAEPCDNDEFSSWASRRLHDLGRTPSLKDCHFLPQSSYVYGVGGGEGGTEEASRKYCDHVLHTENLKEEFDALMLDYGINLSLPEERSRTSATCKLDIEEDVLEEIEDFYAVDFKLLGYQRATRKGM